MKRRFSKKHYILALLALLLAGALIYKVTTNQPSSTSTKSNTGKSATESGPKSSPTKPSPQPAKNANPEVSKGGTLLSPAEQSTYASYHTPGLNTPEESVCVTTPGAICFIQFSKGSQTKTLAKKVVDSSGTATWDWTPSSAGLSKGTWTVTATATLNGQSKSGTDALGLEVQ